MKYLLIASLILSACTAVQVKKEEKEPDVSIPAPTEKPPLQYVDGQWNDGYDSVLLAAIGPNTYGYEPLEYCPKFKNVGTEKFWKGFIKAVSYYESGWKNSRVYEESFKDQLTKKKALSVGLMQLSVGDSLNYSGPCKDLTDEKLKTPEVNLSCTMTIIEKLITNKRKLGVYWSVIAEKKYLPKFKSYVPECF